MQAETELYFDYLVSSTSDGMKFDSMKPAQAYNSRFYHIKSFVD